MIQIFERDGVRFQYPGNWSVETAADEAGWTVTVQSPETAFLLVSLRPEADNAAALADETLTVLRAEYKDLDAENALETLAGQAAIGHDIDFLTLDTTVTCRTLCLETPAGPLLVMYQVSEFDRAQLEPVLRAALASLAVEEE